MELVDPPHCASARSPEELDTMLEDAFIVGDASALAELFEDQALLVSGRAVVEARGRRNIARAMPELWNEWRHPAGAGPVFQAGNLAVCGHRVGTVLRRGSRGVWKVAIAVVPNTDDKEHNHD